MLSMTRAPCLCCSNHCFLQGKPLVRAAGSLHSRGNSNTWLFCTRAVVYKATTQVSQHSTATEWIEKSYAFTSAFCKCLFVNISLNCAAAAGGILKLAEKMTASFYRAISGTVTPTQTSSSINEWIGSKGAGVDKFDVAVRMVTWMKTGTVAGDAEAGLVLSATTTLWLPSVQPQRVFDYLCDGQLRGQWDVLANGAAVKQLTSIATGPLGNAVSVLCPNVSSQKNFDTLETSIFIKSTLVY